MTKYLREMFSVKLPIIKGGVTIHDIFYPGDELGDWFNEELFFKAGQDFPGARVIYLEENEDSRSAYVFFTGNAKKAEKLAREVLAYIELNRRGPRTAATAC